MTDNISKEKHFKIYQAKNLEILSSISIVLSITKSCHSRSIHKTILHITLQIQAKYTDWNLHDDVIKWKHFPRYWPFVRGIHRSPVNSPHKGQWHGAFMFPLICTWINRWVNNRKSGDLRRYRAHYNVIVMEPPDWTHRSLVSIYDRYLICIIT